MSTFLIVSANGYGNVGDDICAYSGEYIVKSIDPAAKTIITSPPFREDLARQADVIALSGGGILYDRSPENVENYLQYLDYAQQHGKKSVVLGVGVQGIVTDWGKKRYKEILNKADLVTVRSEEDKNQLDDIGVKHVVATQDLGLLADEWVKTPFLKPRIKDTGKPKLGFGILDVRFLQAYKKGNQGLRKYIESIESNIETLSKDFDIWLFAHSKDDEDWRNELAKKHGLNTVQYKNIKDFSRTFFVYRNMDLVVGVRFHSVILGMLARKPVVGIGSAGAKLFKLAASVPTLESQAYKMGDSQKLVDLFGNLRQRYDAGEFKTVPEEELEKIKGAARQNVALLKKALGL